MTIENARWVECDGAKSIIATVDGRELCIPVDPRNRHYAEIIRQGIPIAE